MHFISMWKLYRISGVGHDCMSPDTTWNNLQKQNFIILISILVTVIHKIEMVWKITIVYAVQRKYIMPSTVKKTMSSTLWNPYL